MQVPELLILGVPLMVIVPALVELLKRGGMPTVLAGAASIAVSAVILALVQLQVHPVYGSVATWALASIVYGLASSGLYSQVHKLTGRQ